MKSAYLFNSIIFFFIRIGNVWMKIYIHKYQLILMIISFELTEMINYWLSWQSIATPLIIQCSSDLFVGRFMAITKFVECPVVDKIPLLLLVLYKGQLYVIRLGTFSRFIGINQICLELFDIIMNYLMSILHYYELYNNYLK